MGFYKVWLGPAFFYTLFLTIRVTLTSTSEQVLGSCPVHPLPFSFSALKTESFLLRLTRLCDSALLVPALLSSSAL